MLHSGAAAHMRAYALQAHQCTMSIHRQQEKKMHVQDMLNEGINQLSIIFYRSTSYIFFAFFHCWKNWLPPSLWIESSACAVSQGRKGLVGRIKVSIRNYVKEPAYRSNVSIMMVGWGDKSSTLVLFDSTLGWDQAKGEQPPPSWYWVTSHWTTDEIGWFQNLLPFYVG